MITKPVTLNCDFIFMEPSTEITPPTSFGSYYRLKKIGEGATSRVYLCVHKKTHQKFACKCVSREMLVKQGGVLRFEQELRLLEQLNHPNLLKVLDVVYDDHYIYMITEFCEFGDLFQYLAMQGNLNENEAKRIFRQLLDVVSFIHDRKIVHRDLKPENILLDEHKNIKLADFGLCKVCQSSLLSTPCGSPYYAAPELIMGKKYSGVQADIWSMGVVLYAMVTGLLPWTKFDFPAVFKEITTGSFTIPTYISISLRLLLCSMLNIHPNERCTLDEMKEHPWVTGEASLSLSTDGYSLEQARKDRVGRSTPEATRIIGMRHTKGPLVIRPKEDLSLKSVPEQLIRKSIRSSLKPSQFKRFLQNEITFRQ